MHFPDIIHHGAIDGVTGSCHELLIQPDVSVLVDCGLFQGAEQGRGGNAASPQIDFDISGVQALVATHVHVDHVGRVPWLLAAGFAGPIICSEPTARLLPIVLEDALQFSVHMERELRERLIRLIESRLVPLPYKRWHTVIENDAVVARVRLQRAGHILGSAFVEFDLRYRTGERRRIVFSGDLGAPHAPLLSPPASPWYADTVVLESTYGDRRHEERKHRRERLQQVLEQALADQGTVLVPAFSIGRTQELLYELEEIIWHGRGRRAAPHLDWDELPVILDSPLASRFTEAYKALQPFGNEEAHKRLRSGRHPLAFEQL
ncbi:MAG: MBL fold metallo-hydrolase, partial [Spongiibacteraceae bacterium]|nr:MBL fold metallo-hydrolase [Spongiibacteraceae bacterium]